MRVSAFFLLVALMGCDAVSDGPRSLAPVDASGATAATLESLTAARDAWEAAAIDDYEVRYLLSCFCAGREFQVRVEGGSIVDVWVDGERSAGDREVGVTIDALFEDTIAAFRGADAASARVLSGAAPFLVQAYVDEVSEISDDEVGYEIVGFERTD